MRSDRSDHLRGFIGAATLAFVAWLVFLVFMVALPEAQPGPYSSQIQRAIRSLTSGTTTFTQLKLAPGGTITVNGTALGTSNSAPGNPVGTASLTGVMMGLAGAITTQTGRVCATISGNGANNTINDGWLARLRYGTGTAPVNGAALTGTAIGATATETADLAANAKGPFSVTVVITGLTGGTAYWLDLGVAAITGGTASVTDLNIAAFDIP